MQRIQREEVEQWTPSPRDIDFLRTQVLLLRTGCGRWIAPMGFTFHKVREDKMRLESINTTWSRLIDVLITVKRAAKIGKMIGIDLQIENMADVITIYPG